MYSMREICQCKPLRVSVVLACEFYKQRRWNNGVHFGTTALKSHATVSDVCIVQHRPDQCCAPKDESTGWYQVYQMGVASHVDM